MPRSALLRASAVLAALALLLTGCATGTDQDPLATSASTTPAGPELTGDLTVYAAASLKAAFDELATEFEAQHPSVDV